MSFNPLTELFRYGSLFTGLLAYVIGFVVFVMMWRLSRNRAYFYLCAGFGLSLLSRFGFLLLMISGGTRLSRTDGLSILYRMLTPYVSLIASVLLIVGFVMLGWRAIKTFKAPQDSPPPLPVATDSNEN
ncbi:MAG: hypothetical protein ACPGVU_10530 [Limisphaerales bacterium]